ncbi:DivIVA domain-containing protein [Tepidibacillus fermentans]|uniref:Cell division initiation protein n=1 Tax=Tepidibacillus fermentans TaxID=1281767 RepID=A0A4R3KKJ0_9BACI|nr:DivIVA domain-containing protein [Tepidibacillus fermentans]TCS84395.1 cell division initiation protein [Tepidibacillus fermentans]
MPLTPLDIHNKEFSKAFRGYDEDEVNEFLDQIIKDYEALIRQNKDLEEKILQANERLQHFANIEESLSKSIIVAQEAAEELKANAKKEAQLIVKEAEKNADRIINEALIKSRTIALEIEELKKKASIYRTRFRTLLEAQLEMLSEKTWDELEQLEPLEKVEKDKIDV